MEYRVQHGPATKVIGEIIYANRLDFARSGISLELQIAQALRDAGYLKPEHVWIDEPVRSTRPEPPAYTDCGGGVCTNVGSECDACKDARQKRDRVCIGCNKPEGPEHEPWCPVVTGTLSSLPVKPVIETDELPG